MKEPLSDKIIKHFFGISGPLDEHRMQVIGRIAIKLSIIFFIYLLILPLFALTFVNKWAEQTLWAIAIVTIFLIFITSGYLWGQIEHYQLSDYDLSEKDYKQELKRIKKSTLYSAIFCSIGFPLLMSLMNAFDDDYNFIQDFFSIKSLIMGLIYGIPMALFFYHSKKSHLRTDNGQ